MDDNLVLPLSPVFLPETYGRSAPQIIQFGTMLSSLSPIV